MYICYTRIHTCLFTKIEAIFLQTLRSFPEQIFHKTHLNDHFYGVCKSKLIKRINDCATRSCCMHIHLSNTYIKYVQLHIKFLLLHIALYLSHYSEFYTITLFRYIFYRSHNSRMCLSEKKSCRKF